MTPLPVAARPFVGFCRLLHDQGFAVTGDRTIAFLQSVALLGPRGIGDIYWGARATLAPPPDRLSEFDALFNATFREDFSVIPKPIQGEETPVAEAGTGTSERVAVDTANPSGSEATAAEALTLKEFRQARVSDRLARMRRRLAAIAPHRRGYRHVPAKHGIEIDLRRTLARMVRGGVGDARPAWTGRRERLRRVLLLIDISGSMKTHTHDHLRFAHALTQTLPEVETFSFGTRLTRLTKSLRRRDQARALAEIGPAVADWDGGTRIADSLAAFLSVPRFSRASRGALVVVLSDGLERGDAAPMARAVRRLAGRSWRLAWLTPLAADPAFQPETAGLKAILNIVDHLGDGSGLGPLCDFIEDAGRLARAAPAPGRAAPLRTAAA